MEWHGPTGTTLVWPKEPTWGTGLQIQAGSPTDCVENAVRKHSSLVQSLKADQIRFDLGANCYLPCKTENPECSVQAGLKTHIQQGFSASPWQNPHPRLRGLKRLPIFSHAVPGSGSLEPAVSLLGKWGHGVAAKPLNSTGRLSATQQWPTQINHSDFINNLPA